MRVKKRRIVKVQIDSTGKTALVYDHRRDILFEGVCDDALRVRMNGSRKRFFYAAMQRGALHIGEPAPTQDW